MTNTKKSLIASGVSLAVSVALLVGSTFAWFTDSVTNKGNKIQAGNLKIGAYAYDLDTDGTGESFTIEGVNGGEKFTFEAAPQDLKTNNSPIINETLWEPGKSSAKLLQVKNEGTLAAEIKLSFETSGELEGALWFDFVKVDNGKITGKFEKRPMSTLGTFAANVELPIINSGDTLEFILVYGMYEEAGNEYKDKDFTADVTILAKQYTYEKDGFGSSDYDAAAEYDGDIGSEASLIAAVENGGMYRLTGDIELAQSLSLAQGTEFVLDLNGNGLSFDSGYVFSSEGNLTINGSGTLSGLGAIKSTGGTVIINGGTFNCSSRYQDGDYQHTLKAENSEVIINGGTFDTTVNGQSNAMIGVAEGSTVTINGGTFRNVEGSLTKFDPYLFNYEEDGKLVINGGTFYGGWRFNGVTATTDIYGGEFTVSYDGQSFNASSTHVLTVYGGTFNPSGVQNASLSDKIDDLVAGGYFVKTDENGIKTVLPDYRRNEITVTAQQLNSAAFRIEENTTYYFEPGTYSSGRMQFFLHGKENVAFVAKGDVVVDGNMTVGYHMGQDGSNPLKTGSTLLVSGFTVNGELKVSSADQKVIIKDNNVNGQLTVTAFKIDGMEITLENNTVDGTVKGPQGYGMYIVPDVTDYTLNVSNNIFRNIDSHAVCVQGCGQGSAVTAAKSIQLTNNTFESWGIGGKDNRGSFKIWADTRFAPESISDESGLTPDAKALVQEILAGNNKYMSDLDNTVIFEFFDYGFDALS